MADTVLGYGAWKLKWDPSNLPPVRPVEGYLPRFGDFAISGDTVRYLKGGSGIHDREETRKSSNLLITIRKASGGFFVVFPKASGEKRVEIFGLNGKSVWSSGPLTGPETEIFIDQRKYSGVSAHGGILLRVSLPSSEEIKLLPVLFP
jgi:hypothetical protein